MSNRVITECNVAVVGGAGFLGSHMVNHLIEDRRCKVTVIDNLEVGRREFIHPEVRNFYHHDITGSESYLESIFRNQRIDYVFNYAAQPYVPDSYKRPGRVFDVNCMGAMKVINAADTTGIKGILQVSSAEVYGNATSDKQHDSWGKIKEVVSVEPHSSYGASKAAIDAYCQVSYKERQTPVIALRQFNCIGERDETHPYVLPEIIKQLSTQDSQKPGVVHLGNNSTRDFMYAGDAVKLACGLLECGSFGEVYNLGSEESVKIYDLAKLVGALMGFPTIEIVLDPSRVRSWEIWHLRSDNSKIRSVVKGTTITDLTSLEEAVSKTIQYMRENNWRLAW